MAYEAEKDRIYSMLTQALGITRKRDAALEREAEKRAFEARQQVGLTVCGCADDWIVHPSATVRRQRLGVPISVGTAEIATWNYMYLDPIKAAVDGWLNSTPHRAVLDSTPYDYWGCGIYTELPEGETSELQRRWYIVMWFSTEPIDQAMQMSPTEIFPAPKKVHFLGGSHVGYKFAFDGKILDKKTATISDRGSSASADGRSAIPTRSGKWLRIVNGIWAGYWVQEDGFEANPDTEVLS